MLSRKFTCLLFFSLLFFAAAAQRSANWFFGTNAGIKFTSTGLVNQPTSVITTDEGCSSISDTAGNLLFYTDGITVWNKNHAVMTNGGGLWGHSSSSQSSIVVPMPGHDGFYYLFTATLPFTTNGNYTYNVIDMHLQGGLGEVTQKNVVFGGSRCSERITAVQHANKKDFWIVTNPLNTDSFKVYLLSDAGFNFNPVITKMGKVVNSNFGMLKGSPDGKMIIHTVSNFGGFDITQLFRFDDGTGMLYGLVNIPFAKSYGCAFSPDSKRLYLNNSFPMTGSTPAPGSFAQFTVRPYDSAAIAASRYDIPFPGGGNQGGWGDLSVGPDSVMYIARHSKKRLSAIKRPNDSAAACQYVDTFFVLTGTSHYGLPNFYNNINIPPHVTINMVRLSCLQYRFSFATNYNGTGVYTWDFGDMQTSADSSPIHSFTRNGIDSFLVKFRFLSTDGTVDINVQSWLKLPGKPIAAFTAQTNGCVEQAVNFTNTSTSPNGNLGYYWNFGDNTTDNIRTPVKKYNDTNTYLVKLSVSDELGCISDTATTTVAINKKAVARFGLSGPYCTNSGIAVSDTSFAWNTTISQWRYDFGGTVVTSTAPVAVTSYASQGSYPVKVVLQTAAGCVSDTVTRMINVFEKPNASFQVPQSCVTDLSSFSDNSSVSAPSVINKWRWYFDDPAATNDTSLLRNPSYQYTAASNYNVQLVVTTDRGCIDTLVTPFTVNGAQPSAALSFIQNPVCGGDSVQLVSNSTVNFGSLVALQVNWGNGLTTDASPLPGENYKNIYPLFGTPATVIKPIRLTVQSGTSCISVLDTFITIKAQPQVQMQAVASVCGNGSAIVLNQGSETSGAAGSESYFGAGVSYQGSTGSYIFNPSAATGNTAQIGYRYATPGGCVDSAFQVITILPKPVVNAGPDQTILLGNSVLLDATASGTGLTYAWTPSLWLSNATILKPDASPLSDTTYWLKVTTSDNCTDSSDVFIRVLPPVIPVTAFSPNGDGINETWQIANLKDYPTSLTQVFTRWGQLVYQSRGYAAPWDGTSKGTKMPPGTYYYIVTPGQGRPPVAGWVQLVR
jgi:gliding motility-associated-like protein